MTDTTTEPAPVRPRLGLQEALEGLTIGEVAAIERHYGQSLESGKLSGTLLSAGVAWAYERRYGLADSTARPEWPEIESRTMKWLNDYFEPDETEVDEEGPQTDQGKGDSLDA